MAAWIETCRSVVSPWECDVTEHFTIAYYFDRLADAAATAAENLGLGSLKARNVFRAELITLRAAVDSHTTS